MPYDKSRLPSLHVSVGPARAPLRSYYYAMGMTEEEIARPFVGVATTWNEATPCNISLARQAQAVKKGVKAAKGAAHEFTTITVTDGIAMGHAGMKSSLASREVIADSVELTMRGHCYDALVGLAGDMIVIDAVKGTLDVELSAAELAKRKKSWKPRKHQYKSGTLWCYAQTVGDAEKGADTHPGGKAETVAHADL